MDDIEVYGSRKTPLNARDQEEARCYLSFIGNFCGSNTDDGKGCGNTVSDLETLWKAKFLNKKQKVPERKHPFLFVNEKKGYGLHRTKNGKFQPYGNICYYCKSCQMLYDRRVGDNEGEKISFESRKSHEIRPKFKNDLRDHLAKHIEICKKACINKWSGMPRYTCSQQLLYNALDQELGITFDLIDKFEFGIECNYIKCDGQHIILMGNPPIVKSDYNAFVEENSEKDD